MIIRSMILAGAMILTSGAALAVDLTGTWTGSDPAGRGASAGPSDHELRSGDAFLNAETDEVWTLTIEGMEGSGFHAEWCSATTCEDAVGVVRADGESVLMADEDGVFIGTVQGDQMELCYLEPGETFRIADCHMMEKQ